MKALLLYVLTSFLAFSSQVLHGEPRHLTISQAEKLILIEIRNSYDGSEHLPGFTIEHTRNEFQSNFMTFNVSWRGLPDAGMTIAYIDVNMRNADMWESCFCREIVGRRVRDAQLVLRRKLGVDDNAYRRFRIPGAFCEK